MITLCVGPECDRQSIAKNLCNAHYQQQNKGLVLKPVRRTRKTRVISYCPVPGCEREVHARGLCTRHSSICIRHHINTEDYLLLYSRGCHNPACSKTEDLQVDHIHACCTGASSCGMCVRGLLCHRCNLAVAAIENNHNSAVDTTGLKEYLNGAYPTLTKFVAIYRV
jgi:hypothetical protein